MRVSQDCFYASMHGIDLVLKAVYQTNSFLFLCIERSSDPRPVNGIGSNRNDAKTVRLKQLVMMGKSW